MLWNIYINFGHPSDKDVMTIHQVLEDVLISYGYNDIVRELEETKNQYEIDGLRLNMIVEFKDFLKFMLVGELVAGDGYMYIINDLNRYEAYFWCKFKESLDERLVQDFTIETIASSHKYGIPNYTQSFNTHFLNNQ